MVSLVLAKHWSVWGSLVLKNGNERRTPAVTSSWRPLRTHILVSITLTPGLQSFTQGLYLGPLGISVPRTVFESILLVEHMAEDDLPLSDLWFLWSWIFSFQLSHWKCHVCVTEEKARAQGRQSEAPAPSSRYQIWKALNITHFLQISIQHFEDDKPCSQSVTFLTNICFLICTEVYLTIIKILCYF